MLLDMMLLDMMLLDMMLLSTAGHLLWIRVIFTEGMRRPVKRPGPRQ
jgi:hypothetical protein